MRKRFYQLAFGPKVRDEQAARGSPATYRSEEIDERMHADVLTSRGATYLSARDDFYLATNSESGWPYVQYRGGPAGFVRQVAKDTIGWAEFGGNRQFISTGNSRADDRVAMIFVDYARRRRLKVLGRLAAYRANSRPDLKDQLEIESSEGDVEGYMLVRIEAFDWNCPQHIVPRLSFQEVERYAASLQHKIDELQVDLAAAGAQKSNIGGR